MTFDAVWVLALTVGLILISVYLLITLFMYWLGGIMKRWSGK